ncbi:MAG TPA: hypothetical protein VFK59_11310 [Actinomycetota bacterium]|jgi:hypothetical protein|nr:hypothetical protein [Actinomycetota bacterium]
MRRLVGALVLVVALGAAPAGAKVIGISASPNPAGLGDRVRHSVEVGAYGPLDVWVSARGFERPATGTLPAGAWSYECCPSQTAGTPAWHYRASSARPGSYGFNATTRARGSFLSTARVAGSSTSVWVWVR